jgi:hypothetical protein
MEKRNEFCYECDLTINTSQGIESMIASGAYDHVDSGAIINRFLIDEANPSRKIKIAIFNPGCFLGSYEDLTGMLSAVNKDLKNRGDNRRCRFAKIEEVLALGAHNHDLQRQFPMLSVVIEKDGEKALALLGEDYGEYGHEGDDHAIGDFRFLYLRDDACLNDRRKIFRFILSCEPIVND